MTRPPRYGSRIGNRRIGAGGGADPDLERGTGNHVARLARDRHGEVERLPAQRGRRDVDDKRRAGERPCAAIGPYADVPCRIVTPGVEVDNTATADVTFFAVLRHGFVSVDRQLDRLARIDAPLLLPRLSSAATLCTSMMRQHERFADSDVGAELLDAGLPERRDGAVAQAAVGEAAPDRGLVGAGVGGAVGGDDGVAGVGEAEGWPASS